MTDREIPDGTIERLAQRLATKPIHEIMRDDERAAGYRVIFPGEFSWFPLLDWCNTCVVSINDRDVRLVAIRASRPRAGAFRRLISGIKTAGLRPVVVSPIGDAMPAIMKKWRWKRRTIGTTFETQQTIFFPTDESGT